MLRLWWLARIGVRGDVYDTVFSKRVVLERVVDFDTGQELVEVRSNGLPNHRYNSSRFVARNVETVIGTGISGVGKIGVAINGVEIHSYINDSGVDLVRATPAFDAVRQECWGFAHSDAYVYRTAPPCLYVDVPDGLDLELSLRLGYLNRIGDALAASARLDIIGVMLDGHVLYGPLDEHGRQHTGLDECNGKYDAQGNYAYYATFEPPYTIGCFVERSSVCTNSPGSPQSGSCSNCRIGEYAVAVDGTPQRCPRGSYCIGDCTKVPCRAGTYGAGTGLSGADCTGLCPSGHFCPEGATQPSPCGRVDLWCPSGSATPSFVQQGWYGDSGGIRNTHELPCEPGYYCDGGVRLPCPPGTYGPTSQLTKCMPCPVAAVCANPATTVPTPLQAGRYGNNITGLTRHDEAPLCPAGQYCPLASTKPTPCPAGVFGSTAGASRPDCRLTNDSPSSQCPAGYVCVNGTVNPFNIPCGSTDARNTISNVVNRASSVYDEGLGDAAYCPPGSPVPRLADSGYYTVGPNNAKTDQRICSPGFYCLDGTKRACPAGKYGAVAGLAIPECSGDCSAGYYCPPASARQFACGNASVYCPRASIAPKLVGHGNYSSMDDSDGPSVAAATASSDVRASERICEPGYYCLDGIRRPCPAGFFGASAGLASASCDGSCPPGMYCIEASTEAIPTPAGVYCRQGKCTSPEGNGQCAPGFYCPQASTAPNQRPCCDARRDDITGLFYTYGNGTSVDLISLVSRDGEEPPGLVRDNEGWHQHHVYAPDCERLYCPPGSAQPRLVDNGYYATGGNRTTRTGQAPCHDLDSEIQHPLLLGGKRAPACPTTTTPTTSHFFGTGLDGLASTPFGQAWDTPLFLGLGEYEWDRNQHDAYHESVTLLRKHQLRFASVDVDPLP